MVGDILPGYYYLTEQAGRKVITTTTVTAVATVLLHHPGLHLPVNHTTYDYCRFPRYVTLHLPHTPHTITQMVVGGRDVGGPHYWALTLV